MKINCLFRGQWERKHCVGIKGAWKEYTEVLEIDKWQTYRPKEKREQLNLMIEAFPAVTVPPFCLKLGGSFLNL